MKETGKPSKTLEQKRAAKAWAHVNEIVSEIKKKEDTKSKLGENYRSGVRKAPAMIKTNGLGQTLAFLLSKEEKKAVDARNNPEKPEGYLYKHLEEWLCGGEAPIPWPPELKDKPLVERVMEVDSTIYLQATQEALAYLGWLKRFAEACFGKSKGGG